MSQGKLGIARASPESLSSVPGETPTEGQTPPNPVAEDLDFLGGSPGARGRPSWAPSARDAGGLSRGGSPRCGGLALRGQEKRPPPKPSAAHPTGRPGKLAAAGPAGLAFAAPAPSPRPVDPARRPVCSLGFSSFGGRALASRPGHPTLQSPRPTRPLHSARPRGFPATGAPARGRPGGLTAGLGRGPRSALAGGPLPRAYRPRHRASALPRPTAP